jgi:hypothetical protein
MQEDLRSKRADNENQKYHLKDIQFSDLQPITGHPRNIEILAGKKFETNIVVTVPFSIICVSFQTPEFDIQIGLYRARWRVRITVRTYLCTGIRSKAFVFTEGVKPPSENKVSEARALPHTPSKARPTQQRHCSTLDGPPRTSR